MITIKNKAAIQKMTEAGRLLSEIFDSVPTMIKPGVNTQAIDAWFEKQMIARTLAPKCKGYHGYKHVSCISVNDEVVHSVPSVIKILTEGDLVTVDVCASWQGYCADMARSYFVGEAPSPEAKKLVTVAQQALDRGISMARPGNHLSDISAAIQAEVEKYGFGVVRDFAGHGIGKQMHEDPEILNYGQPGQGPVLRPGMTFALEPMITLRNYDVYITEDGWTVKTSDKSLAAHVEDTVVITENEPKVITRKQLIGTDCI